MLLLLFLFERQFSNRAHQKLKEKEEIQQMPAVRRKVIG